MNDELYKIMTFKNSEVSEREIVLKGNLKPLYKHSEVDRGENHLILFTINSAICDVITSFGRIKEASIHNAQYCLIELSDKEIEKIVILIEAMNMNLIDIIYDSY